MIVSHLSVEVSVNRLGGRRSLSSNQEARFVAPGFEAIRLFFVSIAVSYFVIIMRVANVCHAVFALRILVVVSGVADVYSPTAGKCLG